MKRLLIVVLSVFLITCAKATAVVTDFTAAKVGDSVQFNWTVNEDNMYYYEVMEVININGSEKLLIHTDATSSTQTTGATYQASAAMSRALMVGFPVILIVLLFGSLVCWNKTIRNLALTVSCIFLLNTSCKKDNSGSDPQTGNPDVPGKSSTTQGVFRLKTVDLNGNIGYTGYVVVTY